MSLELNDNDFVLASFPRSGNTWLRFIFANLMSRSEVEITFHNYHLYIPDIHVIKDFSEWRSYPPFPRIIKSHFLPQPGYKNAIYIVRDPRSAILSYWHYQGRPCDFENYIISEDIWPAVWNNHVEQWVDYAKSNNVLIVKYEDILFDTFEQIQKILKFMNVENIGKDFIEQSINRSNIENMNRIEKEKGFWRRLSGDTFIRSGKPDDWKEEVSQPILEKIIERNYKMMAHFNYI